MSDKKEWSSLLKKSVKPFLGKAEEDKDVVDLKYKEMKNKKIIEDDFIIGYDEPEDEKEFEERQVFGEELLQGFYEEELFIEESEEKPVVEIEPKNNEADDIVTTPEFTPVFENNEKHEEIEVGTSEEPNTRNIGSNGDDIQYMEYYEPLEPKQYKSPFTKNMFSSGSKTAKVNRIRTKKMLWSIFSYIVATLAVIFIFTVCIRNTVVKSASMEPTLKTGSIVMYNKLSYVFHEVERGDIILFWSEEENEYMAKRILGLPGDEITFADGYVKINGKFADESAYLDTQIETNCSKSFTVPEGKVFVLGDNRENSKDSRFFIEPYIDIGDIEGKYLGTIPELF